MGHREVMEVRKSPSSVQVLRTCSVRTRGSETSQYPEEKKTILDCFLSDVERHVTCCAQARQVRGKGVGLTTHFFLRMESNLVIP
jgi:hypothetical protein